MDRLDFSKSIINVDPVTQIRLFFNETMAMYDLSEGLNYNCIKGAVDDKQNSIQFTVTFNANSREEIEKIKSSMIGRTVSIYNKVYSISGNVEGSADAVVEMTLQFNEIIN